MRLEPQRTTPCEGDVAGQVALLHPTRVCCVDDETHVTWEQHIVLRNKMVNMMHEKGLSDGDSVACYGRNCNEWILVRTSCNAVGVFFVPLNWNLPPADIEFQIANSNVKFLFVEKIFEPIVLQLNRSKMPHLKGIIYFEDLNRLLSYYSAGYPEVSSYQKNRKMLYTGGTSGNPKGVLRSSPPPAKSEAEQQRRDELTEGKYGSKQGLNILSSHIVHLVAAPLYHAAAGFFETFTYNRGGTVVLMKEFNVLEMLSNIDLYAVKTLYLPPILLKRIVLEVEPYEMEKYSLKSLQSICMTGGHCPMAVKEAAIRKGLPIYEFYGSSEAGCTAILQPDEMLSKPNSCGRVAIGSRVKIVSPKTKEEVGTGESGIIYIQSAESRTLSYYGSKELTIQAQLPDDPSFVTVGDVGRIDNEGYLFINDRLIDMIITNGEHIYPAEIESALHSHPSIADCAVFGIPDPAYGEQVRAVVQPKAGCSPTVAEIMDHLNAVGLPKSKHPKCITFSDSLPRTPSGKLLKRNLREPFWKDMKCKL